MTDRTMSGAELKVQLTGLGLTPVWLGVRLGVTTRTVIRWFDLDEVPTKAVDEIDRLLSVTADEMNKILYLMDSGDSVLYTQRIDGEGVANCNTFPASWHRALTFRVLQHVRAQGFPASVAYGTTSDLWQPTNGTTIDGMELTPNDPVNVDELVDAGVLAEFFRGKGEPTGPSGVYTVTT